MSIFDGFLFWIGKQLAELAVFIAFVVAIVIYGSCIEWKNRRSRQQKQDPRYDPRMFRRPKP